MCWRFIACGFYPSQNHTPPLVYFVIVVNDWWLFGSADASLDEWAHMLRVQGQQARDWPDAPSPKTAARQLLPALAPSMLLAGIQGI